MKELFDEILEKHLVSLGNKDVVDKNGKEYEIFIKSLPDYLSEIVAEGEYSVKGSVGTGRSAEVPWVGIFNTNITNSAQSGYYICYLFSKELNSIFLSIIHSITNKGEEQSFLSHKETITYYRKQLSMLNFGKYNNKLIKFEQTPYLGKQSRAKKYSESIIAYIQYKKDEIPNDEILLRDFNLFLDMYKKMEKLTPNLVENEATKNLLDDEVLVKIENIRNVKYGINHINTYITSKGFNYSLTNIKNLYLSLRSKPFVIISGISGTGKTKIVQLFAESIGATEDNGQFMLVPVRPDWSDSSELLGYKDIKGDFMEGQLTKLINHAIDHPDRPHFLLLDEMNLARVEYYFSDILSVMESRKVEDGEFTSSALQVTDDVTLHLPGNLYIIGTVNMDETTHPFSKKVLDRANTIEFNEIDLNTFGFLQQQHQIEPLHVANESLQANYIQLPAIYDEHSSLVQMVSQQLTSINVILKEIHAQVGYRVRDEICFYMAHNAEGDMLLTEDEALDFCYMQKILPRIAGSGLRVEKVLEQLVEFMQTRHLPRSQAKLEEMQRRLKEDEFTSFWIS